MTITPLTKDQKQKQATDRLYDLLSFAYREGFAISGIEVSQADLDILNDGKPFTIHTGYHLIKIYTYIPTLQENK